MTRVAEASSALDVSRRRLLEFGLLGLAALAHPGRVWSVNSAPNGRRLILVELAGANDGLNTVVPWREDEYRRLRPTLALPRSEILEISDELGLHRALRPLMPAWEAGELAILQGLGYPQPNRSHFKSIALWETAGDGRAQPRTDGWITHDIEHSLGRAVSDAHGISLGGGLGPLSSDSGRWLSIRSVEELLAAEQFDGGRASDDSTALGIVRQQFDSLDTTLQRMTTKLRGSTAVGEPRGALGLQVQQLIRLVESGVDTPVFRLRLDGFDTHESQLGRHDRLLRDLALGIRDLRRQLIRLGEWNQTIVLTYSEFGRRAAENNTGGTDHGTAAPHFMLGGRIAGGLHGKAPDLSTLVDADPRHTMDYRAVYEQVLSGWFEVSDNRLVDFREATLTALFG